MGIETQPAVLSQLVITTINHLKEDYELTFEEHRLLYSWESHFWMKTLRNNVIKQFCPICKDEVQYFPRYPKYICNSCGAKGIEDEDGLQLGFSNVGMSGGLLIQYFKDGEVVKEDDSQYSKMCYSNGYKLIATEARFGGIVIQLHDETEPDG